MITIRENKGVVYISCNNDNIAHGMSFKLKELPFKQICKLIYFKIKERFR